MMTHDVRRVFAVLFCTAAMTAGVTDSAKAIELIENGGFETGDFTGWAVDDLPGSSGSFFVDDNDGVTPFSNQPTVGAASGDFYAVSDQFAAGTHVLSQEFTVPGPALSVVLRFDMFVNDADGGPIIDPIGLDHTGPSNQHSRVDLLTPGGDPFDTGADVLENFFIGVDPQPLNPNLYTSYEFDITALVGEGGIFVLRFGEVDNQLFLNQGVDNVSVQFTAIPEPSGGALALVASLAGLLQKRRRA